jgi:DNA-binding protein H-NS
MTTLEQIQAKMKKLQSQAEALIAKQSSAVLSNIKTLMEKHGLTTADIDAHAGDAQKRGRKPGVNAANGKVKAVAKTKSGLPPKYRDPKTGATWSGHARPPTWIKDVKDRTRFLIAGDAAVVAASGATGKAKAAFENASEVGHTGQRKGPQPAKYRDPKSGATWSGRGPAPAWLAAVKDRAKFLIEGANAVTTETRAANKASKTNTTSKSGAVSRKAAVKKVAATKVSTAKKAVVAKKATAKKAPATKAAVAARNTVAAKKEVTPAATKAPVKKAPAKKTVAKVVVAKPDVAAPTTSVTVQATA